MHCMRMAKTKESEVRHLQVRLTPRLYAAVDRARGPMTRQQWAVAAFEKATKQTKGVP